MKITRLEVFPVSIPYKSPYGIALGITEVGNHVIIKLYTDDGIIGLGEAALIMPDVTGETQENIVLTLRKYFAPILMGKDPFDVEAIFDHLDSLTLGRFGFPYCKAAVDSALYDIMGKALNLPVYKLLGGAYRKTLGVARSLPVKPPEEMAARARELKEQGYKMVTIKVGFDPDEDVQRVIAVRKAVGDTMEIEVDVNQAYRPDIAIRTIKRMEEYGISNVEQPCPWWDLDGLARIHRAVSATIIADEAVHTPMDALNIVRKEAADVICIKLVKNGGFFMAKKIAAIAEAGGLACTMGSRHTFGVGTAAIRHFAASTRIVDEVIGFGTPQERMVDDILKQPLTMENGEVKVPEGPGLGIELDEEKLAKYTREIRD